MKRNPSIELFRCVCMFGVCLLHALTQGGYAGPHRGLDNLMTPSVVGFLFISGWFGVRFSLKHIVRILGVGVYCAGVATGLYTFAFCGAGEPCRLLASFWGNLSGAWFLWCYLALMLIAPAFEPLFEKKETAEEKKVALYRVIPILVLVFAWSYAASKIPILKIYLPHVGGFGGFGVLTFTGIYLAARLCRLFELNRLLKTRTLFVVMVLSGAVCWAGFMHYHSPFALVFAGSLFLLFERLPMRESPFGRTILWLSPSMLSVYIVHVSNMGMTWLRHAEDALLSAQEHNYYLVCFGVAAVLFLGSLLLDLPRRMVLRGVKRAKGDCGLIVV